MNRILMAAARGARIETFEPTGWKESYEVDIGQWFQRLQRIHPDDAHLEYGPVSTALRDEAMQKFRQYGGTFAIPYGSYWLSWSDAHAVDNASSSHRSLFLLILAEALCDEGL